jgi:hypothetical protein
MWFPAANTVAWSTGGSERVRISSSGNVGIGTSSPDVQLDIRSANAFSPQLLVINSTVDAFGPYWNTRKLRGTAAANSGDDLGTFMFQSADTSNAARNACWIVAKSQGAGAAYHSGYFDVNVTSPAGAFANAFQMSSDGVRVGVIGTAALPSISQVSDPNTGIFFPAADTIAFAEGGVEAMRILSTGSVSIGTSSDFNLFGVASATSGTKISVNTFTVNTGDFTGIDFGVTTGVGTSKKGGILFERTGAGGVGTLHLATNNAAGSGNVALADSRLAILSSGNVGIGTTAPGAKLQVNSEIRVSDGTINLRSTVSSGVAFFGNITNHPLAIQTNNVERIRVSADGNVGIGTSTFGTSAVSSFAIATGTAPTTGPADTIQIYSTDLSAGNTMLSLYTEGTIVNANTTAATTHRIAIRVNGTIYYLLAHTSA